ncbi:Transcriptional repressor p66-beta [Lucilia cuprina]|nr:Transcriptional repressor p66-beta [Lucilia cuprina]
MAKMEVDDVVDLSLGTGRDPALTITPTTVRDLRALTQNSGLTITPAPPPPTATSPAAATTASGLGNNSSSITSSTSSSSSSSTAIANTSGNTTPTTNNISTTITTVDPSSNSATNQITNTNTLNNTSTASANTVVAAATTTVAATTTTTNSQTSTNSTGTGSSGGSGGGGSSIGGLGVVSSGNEENKVQRRVLRPRTEPKSYAEAPDIVLLPARMNGRQQNGNIDSETDDEEMPPYVPIKELTPAELKEREKGLRKLRDDLRNEETKLVLLKKLKQSQHVMKENIVVTSTSVSPTNPLAAIPAALTSKGALSVTPTTAVPLPAHTKSSRSNNNNISSSVSISATNSRSNTNSSSTGSTSSPHRLTNNSILPPPRSALPGGATLTPGSSASISIQATSSPSSSTLSSSARSNALPPRTNLPNLTITPSVTITPTSAPPSGLKSRNVSCCNVIVAVSAVLFHYYMFLSTPFL